MVILNFSIMKIFHVYQRKTLREIIIVCDVSNHSVIWQAEVVFLFDTAMADVRILYLTWTHCYCFHPSIYLFPSLGGSKFFMTPWNEHISPLLYGILILSLKM